MSSRSLEDVLPGPLPCLHLSLIHSFICSSLSESPTRRGPWLQNKDGLEASGGAMKGVHEEAGWSGALTCRQTGGESCGATVFSGS